jgi:imidazoleglycerol-phosphate dehydratase
MNPTTQVPLLTQRGADVTRETNETKVHVHLGIDGSGEHAISTGVGFLDHMLAQVAAHGLFDLAIEAQGDLEVDAHHTVEDVALTLGQAFSQALGDRKGIVRMASATVPMDDSLVSVTVDFSGRPYTVFAAAWHGSSIGALPTSLIGHFFESFANIAGCNLHAGVLYGKDDHHQAEALFKAFGRALDAATQIDPRRAGRVPSTKGVV